MSPVPGELVSSIGPYVQVHVDCFVPRSSPVHITRHSFSNWFAVKANFSFSDSL